MATQGARETIISYLQDAIAAEKNFETQLETCAEQGDEQDVQDLFRMHATQTRRQYERLSARLQALGGSESTVKSFFATIFGSMPKVAQVGHEAGEKSTQNLIMNYAVEHSEVAMYEAPANAAAAAGDRETEMLAREIQAEERSTADKIWRLLPRSAVHGFAAGASQQQSATF